MTRRPRLAACLAAAAASALLGACGGDMRADELNRSIATLESTAGDGELLAFGVVEDRTKTTFVRVHARELTEIADHEGEKLNDASAKPEVAEPKGRAVFLAGQISDALGELQTSPENRHVARDVRERLRDLADEAEQLRNGL